MAYHVGFNLLKASHMVNPFWLDHLFEGAEEQIPFVECLITLNDEYMACTVVLMCIFTFFFLLEPFIHSYFLIGNTTYFSDVYI